MHAFRLIVASNEQQIGATERLRWKVYAEEEGMLSGPTGLNQRETDEREHQGTTTHFLVYAGQEPVGTVRLRVARPSTVESGRPHDLDLETKFALSGFGRAGTVLAEVTRYCVLRRFRGTRVTPALFAALIVESARRGVTHWVAAANMETDSAEDAAIAYRLLEIENLICNDFRAHPLRVDHPPIRASRFVYTQGQRLNAQRGDLAGLALPRTLALFATKMGARYIGAPAYDSDFRVFAAPLVVAIADIGPQKAAAGALASMQAGPLARAAS